MSTDTELHFAIPANRAIDLIAWVESNCPTACLNMSRHMSIVDLEVKGPKFNTHIVRLGSVAFFNDAEALFFKCFWADHIRPMQTAVAA